MAKSKPKPVTPTGFEVGKWGEHTRYQCTACSFDTLHPEVAEEHWQQLHVPQPPRKHVSPTLVDRYGKPAEINENE